MEGVMAEIRRLDGTVIEGSVPVRDERIGALLAGLVEQNERGELSALAAVYVTPQATHGVVWQLPLEDYGFPWGLALRGALVLAQGAMAKAVVLAPVLPGDGA